MDESVQKNLVTWQYLLLRAADLIEEHGLATNGDLRTKSTGALCTWGAISWAHHGNEWPKHSLVENVAMRRVGLAIGGDGEHKMQVCAWNNDSSKEVVVAKLREVAMS